MPAQLLLSSAATAALQGQVGCHAEGFSSTKEPRWCGSQSRTCTTETTTKHQHDRQSATMRACGDIVESTQHSIAWPHSTLAEAHMLIANRQLRLAIAAGMCQLLCSMFKPPSCQTAQAAYVHDASPGAEQDSVILSHGHMGQGQGLYEQARTHIGTQCQRLHHPPRVPHHWRLCCRCCAANHLYVTLPVCLSPTPLYRACPERTAEAAHSKTC
jgi:hypothetical protein